jgi:hypothetical protein
MSHENTDLSITRVAVDVSADPKFLSHSAVVVRKSAEVDSEK